MGRITTSNDRTYTATHTIATPSSAAAIQVHKNLNKNQFYWQREVGQADKQLATQLATLLAICQTTICQRERDREREGRAASNCASSAHLGLCCRLRMWHVATSLNGLQSSYMITVTI